MRKIGILLGFILVTILSLQLAEAAQYDLKNMTPEVQSAISSRQARYSELQTLKMSGQVGENNQGYVAVLSGSGAQALVDAENRDRKVIYQTIAEQNNLGPQGIPVIEAVFGEVQREKAVSGETVQNGAGTWFRIQ